HVVFPVAFSRRKMDGVRFQRIRPLRGVRPAVSPFALRVGMEDFRGRRNAAALGSEWSRIILQEPGPEDQSRVLQDQRRYVRCGKAAPVVGETTGRYR